jgi:hypothetical protein
MSISVVSSGFLETGSIITAEKGLLPGTTVNSFITGTGGTGTYSINYNQILTDQPVASLYKTETLSPINGSSVTINYVDAGIPYYPGIHTLVSTQDGLSSFRGHATYFSNNVLVVSDISEITGTWPNVGVFIITVYP